MEAGPASPLATTALTSRPPDEPSADQRQWLDALVELVCGQQRGAPTEVGSDITLVDLASLLCLLFAFDAGHMVSHPLAEAAMLLHWARADLGTSSSGPRPSAATPLTVEEFAVLFGLRRADDGAFVRSGYQLIGMGIARAVMAAAELLGHSGDDWSPRLRQRLGLHLGPNSGVRKRPGGGLRQIAHELLADRSSGLASAQAMARTRDTVLEHASSEAAVAGAVSSMGWANVDDAPREVCSMVQSAPATRLATLAHPTDGYANWGLVGTAVTQVAGRFSTCVRSSLNAATAAGEDAASLEEDLLGSFVDLISQSSPRSDVVTPAAIAAFFQVATRTPLPALSSSSLSSTTTSGPGGNAVLKRGAPHGHMHAPSPWCDARWVAERLRVDVDAFVSRAALFESLLERPAVVLAPAPGTAPTPLELLNANPMVVRSKGSRGGDADHRFSIETIVNFIARVRIARAVDSSAPAAAAYPTVQTRTRPTVTLPDANCAAAMLPVELCESDLHETLCAYGTTYCLADVCRDASVERDASSDTCLRRTFSDGRPSAERGQYDVLRPAQQLGNGLAALTVSTSGVLRGMLQQAVRLFLHKTGSKPGYTEADFATGGRPVNRLCVMRRSVAAAMARAEESLWLAQQLIFDRQEDVRSSQLSSAAGPEGDDSKVSNSSQLTQKDVIAARDRLKLALNAVTSAARHQGDVAVDSLVSAAHAVARDTLFPQVRAEKTASSDLGGETLDSIASIPTEDAAAFERQRAELEAVVAERRAQVAQLEEEREHHKRFVGSAAQSKESLFIVAEQLRLEADQAAVRVERALAEKQREYQEVINDAAARANKVIGVWVEAVDMPAVDLERELESLGDPVRHVNRTEAELRRRLERLRAQEERRRIDEAEERFSLIGKWRR